MEQSLFTWSDTGNDDVVKRNARCARATQEVCFAAEYKYITCVSAMLLRHNELNPAQLAQDVGLSRARSWTSCHTVLGTHIESCSLLTLAVVWRRCPAVQMRAFRSLTPNSLRTKRELICTRRARYSIVVSKFVNAKNFWARHHDDYYSYDDDACCAKFILYIPSDICDMGAMFSMLRLYGTTHTKHHQNGI